MRHHISIGFSRHIDKKLAGGDEVTLGLDGVFANIGCDHGIVQGCIVHAVITAFDVVGKVLADEAIEQSAQHILLEVPAIDSPTDFVGDSPDAAL